MTKINANFNHRKTLRQFVSQMYSGIEALKSVVELLDNGFDGNGTEFNLNYGKYQNQNALFVTDNGDGFSSKALAYATEKFGFSIKDQNNTTMIGRNGAGLSAAMVLGTDFEKTNIIVFSKNSETGNRKFVRNFESLVTLAEGGTLPSAEIITDAENLVKTKSGVVVVVLGFDVKRFSVQTMVNELPKFLPTSRIKQITVSDKKDTYELKPVVFTGTEMKLASRKTQYLGEINFKLFYGGQASNGVMIGSNLSQIISLSSFLQKLPVEQRKMISPKLWAAIEGEILVEGMGPYKFGFGGVDPLFFKSDAAEELILVLSYATEELRRLNEERKKIPTWKQVASCYDMLPG